MFRSLREPRETIALRAIFDNASGNVITIGRALDNNWVVPHLSSAPESYAYMLSRHHARLQVGEGRRLLVQDSGAANGTFVNGVRLRFNLWNPLTDGDILSFGSPANIKDKNGIKMINPWAYKLEGLSEFLPTFGSALPPPMFSGVIQGDDAVLAQQPRIGITSRSPGQPKSQQVKQGVVGIDGRRQVEPGAIPDSASKNTAGQPSRQNRQTERRVEEIEIVEAVDTSSPPQRRPAAVPIAPPAERKEFVIDLTAESDEDGSPKHSLMPPLSKRHGPPKGGFGSALSKQKRPPPSTAVETPGAKRSKPAASAPNVGPAPEEAGPSKPAKAATTVSVNDGALSGIDTIAKEFMCAICQETIVICYAMVPCGHNFCGECLAGWLVSKNDCPTCRQKVDAPPIRQNAIDNAVDALAAQLPREEREVREEKKASWEANKNKLEEQLKAPFQRGRTSRNTYRRHEGVAHALAHGPMRVGDIMTMMQESLMQRSLGRVDARVSGAHTGRWPQHDNRAMAAGLPNTAEQRQKVYCAKYITEERSVACSACRRMNNFGELFIGMSKPGINMTGRNLESLNNYTWHHVNWYGKECSTAKDCMSV